jgi:hypothetical protein
MWLRKKETVTVFAIFYYPPIPVMNIRLGAAGAALSYDSGSTKMMRLRLRNTAVNKLSGYKMSSLSTMFADTGT